MRYNYTILADRRSVDTDVKRMLVNKLNLVGDSNYRVVFRDTRKLFV